jgi:hypothetical protein
MMASGELQAGFTARAGIGVRAPKAAGREALNGCETYHDEIENAPQLEAEWFRQTGRLSDARRAGSQDRFWQTSMLAKSVYAAFTEAKNDILPACDRRVNSAEDRR